MLCSATPGMRFGCSCICLNSKGDLPVRCKYLHLLLMPCGICQSFGTAVRRPGREVFTVSWLSV